jgi:hypothetical protein
MPACYGRPCCRVTAHVHAFKAAAVRVQPHAPARRPRSSSKALKQPVLPSTHARTGACMHAHARSTFSPPPLSCDCADLTSHTTRRHWHGGDDPAAQRARQDPVQGKGRGWVAACGSACIGVRPLALPGALMLPQQQQQQQQQRLSPCLPHNAGLSPHHTTPHDNTRPHHTTHTHTPTRALRAGHRILQVPRRGGQKGGGQARKE